MQYLVLPNFHPEHAGEAAAHERIAEGNALFGRFSDNLGEWLHGLQWTDFTCVLGMLSLIAGATLMSVRRHNLLPTRDPRLAESLAFINQ